MNKREALEICRDMWTWLAEHPGEDKAHAINALGFPRDMLNSCSCCQYVLSLTHVLYCESCPLLSFWRTENGVQDDDVHLACSRNERGYARWVVLAKELDRLTYAEENAHVLKRRAELLAERTDLARRIAQAAIEALEKLDREPEAT